MNKTIVIYKKEPSTLVAIFSSLFSLLGIFTPLTIIFLPLALFLFIVSAIQAAIVDTTNVTVATLISMALLIIGYVLSPVTFAITVGLLNVLVQQ